MYITRLQRAMWYMYCYVSYDVWNYVDHIFGNVDAICCEWWNYSAFEFEDDICDIWHHHVNHVLESLLLWIMVFERIYDRWEFKLIVNPYA